MTPTEQVLLEALEVLVERHLIGRWAEHHTAHFGPALTAATLAIYEVRGAMPTAPAYVGQLKCAP